eukprot:Sspe_Gene.10410::Locus_3482_Transcript_1_1_Confidence_1.000_Length_5372::g.10410::m.10410
MEPPGNVYEPVRGKYGDEHRAMSAPCPLDAMAATYPRRSLPVASRRERIVRLPSRDDWNNLKPLRGLATKEANHALGKAVFEVHERVGTTLHTRKAIYRGLWRSSLQPQIVMLTLTMPPLFLAGIYPASWWEQYQTVWIFLLITFIGITVVLHVFLDVLIYTRRFNDLYKKFTGLLVRWGGDLFTGKVEGLAGLREADSCRVLSVLRNAHDTTDTVLILEGCAFGEESTPWVPISNSRVQATTTLDTFPVVDSAARASGIFELPSDMVLEMEVRCSSSTFRPVDFDCCVAVGRERLRVQFNLETCYPEGGWRDGCFQSIECDVVTTNVIPTNEPCTVTVVGRPHLAHSKSTIHIRDVKLSRRSWRWHSLPEAMTVARPEKDVAMDTGKMRIFYVQEQVLSDSLQASFIPEPPQEHHTLFGSHTNVSVCSVPTPPPAISPVPEGSPRLRTDSMLNASPYLSPTDPVSNVASRHVRHESLDIASLASGSVDPDAASAESSDERDTTTEEQLQGMRLGETRPTPTQLMLFLTQRCMSFLALALVLITFLSGLIRLFVGTSGGHTWQYLLVQAPVTVVLAALPISPAFVLRMLDCYSNAVLRSMIDTENSTIHFDRRTEQEDSWSDKKGTSLADDDPDSSSSTEDETLEGDGEIFGGKKAGEIHLGHYSKNLAGRSPPPDCPEVSGIHLDTFSHPPVTRKLVWRHVRSLIFNLSSKEPPAEQWSGRYDLVNSRNASQALGSLTVLTCVDKAGILSDVVPCPEILLFMRQKEKRKEERLPEEKSGGSVLEKQMTTMTEPAEGLRVEDFTGGTGSRRTSGTFQRVREGEASETTSVEQPLDPPPAQYRTNTERSFITLQLHHLSSTGSLQFADPNWTEHLPALKPLGLTAALHCLQYLEEEVARGPAITPAPAPKPVKGRRKRRHRNTPAPPSKHMRAQLHFDDTILWGKYLYFLGREIGFSESLLSAAGFKVMKRIHTLRPMETRLRKKQAEIHNDMVENNDPTLDERQQMASLVVVDSNGEWQLLSIGAPQFLLEYTTEYWDGSDVCPLSWADRKDLHYHSNEWRRQRDLVTIAFAYRPLPPLYQAYLSNAASGGASDTVHILETENRRHRDRCTTASGDETEVGGASGMSEAGDDDSFVEGEETTLEGLTPDQVYQRLQRKQIFLGMVGLRFPPKHMVQGLITCFRQAGIRFTHFNRGNERMTKAFGEKLGLWTTANDWNSCISLGKGVALDPGDVKARLPHGIEQIKKHLQTTDDVPILVPLFCDSRPVATKQMISILQDYHEVVGCVGSCLNHANSKIFMQSDIGIAIMPTCNTTLIHQNRAITASKLTLFGIPGCPVGKELDTASAKQANEVFHESLTNLFRLGKLLSLPAALMMAPTEYPLYFLLCLIKQARLLLHAAQKVVEAVVSWSMCWCFCCFISAMALLPAPINPAQLCFEVFVIFPLMAMALYQPYEALLCQRVMSIHPNKNSRVVHLAVMKHLVRLWITKYTLTVVVILVIFVWTMSEVSGASVSELAPPSRELMEHKDYYAALHFSQQVAVCCSSLFFVAHSIGSLSRHQEIKVFETTDHEGTGRRRPRLASLRFNRKQPMQQYYNPLEYSGFLIQIFGALLLQLGLSTVAVLYLSPRGPVFGYTDIPYGVLGAACGYSIVVIIIDNQWKSQRRKGYLESQKWKKIDFDTCLGMHSPCGDDRGDEDKGELKQMKVQHETYWDAFRFYSV